MMPKDNHRRNKLEPMHQCGVFVGDCAEDRRYVRIPDPPVDLPLRIRARANVQSPRSRREVRTDERMSGLSGVVNGALPSCIAATHNDECRERMGKLSMQDPEGADSIDEALARHIEEHDEGARKFAKYGHHEASSDKNRSSSSSSSGVIKSREQQQ